MPTFKGALVRFGRGERAIREIEAVKNVSFEVPRGQAMGIIGANGAGKSTLMRTLAGILPPTRGRIEVRGRISALLALGVGFNAALSGRENVILGGLASGLSRKRCSNEPTRSPSSPSSATSWTCRCARIRRACIPGFSVSVHMKPDILLIDEALSAGDASFKSKASAKMHDLMSSARAMFLVSHSLGSVKELCDRAIWMHKGKLMLDGSPDDVIKAYTKFVQVGEDAFTFEDL